MIRALSILLLLAACARTELPAQRPEDFGGAGNRAISPVSDGGFVVSGSSGRGAWCTAARHAEGALGAGREDRLSLIGAIDAAGLTFGSGGSEVRVAGPGVLFTIGPPGAFAFISSGLAEDRTVAGGIADCA